MTPIPNGIYAIARPHERLLTLEHGSSRLGTPAVLLPPTGNPGEQEWQLEGQSNGNVTIRNLRAQTCLNFDGDPEVNKPIGGYAEPREWALYHTAKPFTFHIVLPGGPINGVELAVDVSPVAVFPPRIALRPLDVHDVAQAWRFHFHE